MKYRRAQSGVALVITLIMLAVITLIAVAFLLLSQRERVSVSQTITASEAESMAEAGLARVTAQILADMATFLSNPTNRTATNALGHWIPRLMLGPDLLISITDTNYTNSPYLTPGKITPDDLQSIADLLKDPRVPVFVARTNLDGVTNRFYLDLNRNDRFDPSGIVPVLDSDGNSIPNQFQYAIGDPEWVGVLSRINEAHSGTNRFIGRYAYVIIPVGRTLDIDFIHNQGKFNAPPHRFYRNQGHGSWELNLAAFLADLNTNWWGVPPYAQPYYYEPDITSFSSGSAFGAADEILGYRYANRLPAERSPRNVFGIATDLFADDGIDQYANGRDDLRVWLTEAWGGAPNPQHFFTVHDFFNPKNPGITNFQMALTNAGWARSSYDAPTFYRMLAQLGSDTAPEKRQVRRKQDGDFVDNARINLNYDNLAPATAEQFTNWTVEAFFHTTADRLLRDHGFAINGNTPLSVTNLPVYPTNFYTPAVHRLLQMTLNIFDASTTDGASAYPHYPTALRPVFGRNGGDIIITGYEQVPRGSRNIITNVSNWRDLSSAADRSSLTPADFVYGVPILIGAKKGYPNFNEFMFQSEVQFERKVQVWKDANTPKPTHAAQMFLIGVSNSFGLEAWNSYTNPFPRALEMFTGVKVSSSLSNEEGFQRTDLFVTSSYTNLGAGLWQGRQFRDAEGVVTNLWTNSIVVPFLGYANRQLSSGNTWDQTFATPQWVVSNSVHIRFFMFDNGYLVDAVGPAPVTLSTNVTAAVARAGRYGQLWATNRVGGPGFPSDLASVTMTEGVLTQLEISRGAFPLGTPVDWNDFGNFNNTTLSREGFRQFLNVASNSPVAITNQGFTPQVKIYRRVEWHANDPLVHHLDEDLRRDRESPPKFSGASVTRTRLDFNLGKTNAAYEPWSGDGKTWGVGREHLWDPSSVDPSINNSDSWDFPTNKFASVGALGRVHRGTPWQTIYLKSLAASVQRWTNVHPSLRAHPTNDWRLADVFTVAQHPNASRGRLSVNQTNSAAWSALFSGIEVPVLIADASGALTVITTNVEPAFVSRQLAALVESINARRDLLPGQVFSSLSEFLAVPELSTNSPYLSPPFAPPIPQPDLNPMTDEHYEALAQKILSLVKPGEPRFVVYVFGQSLKPAAQSVIPGGPFRGLCVNYEVTGEMAARAVMRIDSTPQPGPPRLQAVIESFNLLPPD